MYGQQPFALPSHDLATSPLPQAVECASPHACCLPRCRSPKLITAYLEAVSCSIAPYGAAFGGCLNADVSGKALHEAKSHAVACARCACVSPRRRQVITSNKLVCNPSIKSFAMISQLLDLRGG